MATCLCGQWPVEEYGTRCPSCTTNIIEENRVVTVELEAVEPESLMMQVTPQDVWLRISSAGDDSPMGWPTIAIRGPYDQVQKFVDRWWGMENLFDDDTTLADSDYITKVEVQDGI